MTRWFYILILFLAFLVSLPGCSKQEGIMRTIMLHATFPAVFKAKIRSTEHEAVKIICSAKGGDCSQIEVMPDKTGMEGTPVSFSVTVVNPPFSVIRSQILEAEVLFTPVSGNGPSYTVPILVPVRSWVQTHFWWLAIGVLVLFAIWIANILCRLVLIGAFGKLKVLRPMNVQGTAIFPRRRFWVFHFSRNTYSIGSSTRDDQCLQGETWKGLEPRQIQLKYRRDSSVAGGVMIDLKSSRQFFYRWGKTGIIEEKDGNRSFDVKQKPDYDLLPDDDIKDVLVLKRRAYKMANHLEIKSGERVTLVYAYDSVLQLHLKR
jgi:hypothetical protein